MALKESWHGDCVIVYPGGSLMGGPETDELDRRICELAETGNKDLVINLAGVYHLNSTALNMLLRAHSHYAKRGGRVCLCNADKRIKVGLVITKLAMVFDVYETEEQAVAAT